MIDVQIKLRKEVDELTAIMVRKDIEIMDLKEATMKRDNEEQGQIESLSIENETLCDKVENLQVTIEDLTKLLLTNHAVENERMTMLLR